MTPNIPFADKKFSIAVKEYSARNSYRRERQKARKLKRELKLARKKRSQKKCAKGARQKLEGKKKM